MMSKRQKRGEKAGAGVTGMGAGTVVVLVARCLKDESSFKAPLLIAAPSISVIVGAFVFWANKNRKIWWSEHQLKKAQRKISLIVQEGLNDKNTSDEHKNHLKKRLEEFRSSQMDNQLALVKSLSDNYQKVLEDAAD